jgi:hypothetical protein
MNKIHLPLLRVPNSRNRSSNKSNLSVWHRLYQTHTGSSYRHSCYYNEIDSPKNDLDFRLRTCYDHSQETFASKERMLIQPITIFQVQKFNSSQITNYPFKIINKNRKEHFNKATKTSDNFVNSKHDYLCVTGGDTPID